MRNMHVEFGLHRTNFEIWFEELGADQQMTDDIDAWRFSMYCMVYYDTEIRSVRYSTELAIYEESCNNE